MEFFKTNESHWIGLGNQESAPCLRKEFECSGRNGVFCAVSGVGYYELYVNGKKVGDRVLDPLPAIYLKHVPYAVYDISEYLRDGQNTVGVMLGNGWFNCQTEEVWDFVKAPWRSFPKMRLEIRKEDALLAASDLSWKGKNGPVLFNALRNGEIYDARKELGDWTCTGYDASDWDTPIVTHSPGGLLREQTGTPCRVIDTFELVHPNRNSVYDTHRNMSGHCRITVKGKAGTKVTLDYRERLTDDGEVLSLHHGDFVRSGQFQHEEYILKGDGVEIWESRFSYHGFQYVHIQHTPDSTFELLRVEAREVGTAFDTVGSFESSSYMANELQKLTLRSYRANFVGIPTDCPHREKNGWTGDAQIASETGLYNYDARLAYEHWIAVFRDGQREDGNLPCIVPTGGWGFNWGNGPCWDCAMFVIPYNLYLYTGDVSALKDSYEAMVKYVAFAETMTVDGVVQWGLGDWCPPDWSDMVDSKFSCTAAYYGCLNILSEAAALFGRKDDARKYADMAKNTAAALNRVWYKGNGVYAKGELTAMGTALYFGFCEDSEKQAVLDALVKAVRDCDCTAMFGILGAKYVPRVLADNGYADLAFRILTQDKYPGWGHWVRRGATTLWETWDGMASRNHIMFGDVSAWFYRYAGGFVHRFEQPGWKTLAVEPVPVPGLAHSRTAYRGYVSECTNADGVFKLRLTVPDGCTALVRMPGGASEARNAGTHEFEVKL